jgi:hypothetical protein
VFSVPSVAFEKSGLRHSNQTQFVIQSAAFVIRTVAFVIPSAVLVIPSAACPEHRRRVEESIQIPQRTVASF